MTIKTVFFGARRAGGTGLGAGNSLTRSKANGSIGEEVEQQFLGSMANGQRAKHPKRPLDAESKAARRRGRSPRPSAQPGHWLRFALHAFLSSLRAKSARNKRSPLRRGFLLIPFAIALAWLALAPAARAVSPAPDGGYPNANTAEGNNALFSLTTGVNNTAIGFQALLSNTTGTFNTASGAQALLFNTTGSNNTANGAFALFLNTNGNNNTATGNGALDSNTTGADNTANGFSALFSNRTGTQNTANGFQALFRNTTGTNNIALGFFAGQNLTTGDNNIAIGNGGIAGESNSIRIGANGTHTLTNIAGIRGATVASGVAVVVGTGGRLGTVTSSARFKDQIKPMDRASEAILALKPVTFRYKHELDPEGIPQFGLVAEQVEKVNPDLVARDEQGKVNSVRYEAVNAMLLNEFLKEHRKVRELEAAIAQQKKDFAQQQKEIKALAASLKEQALQIRKVSDQREVSKIAPQTATGG